MKKNKKIAGILAGTLAVGVVAGSFAYYSDTKELDNTMSTNIYGDTLTEVFTPDDDWEPGEEADKIVGVTNTGDSDIVVRIKMSETWTFTDDSSLTIASTAGIDGTDSDFQPASTETADQLEDDDGLTDDGKSEPTDYDSSVVYKEFVEDLATYWTYNSTDGYWYYNDILESGKSTGALLESITLCKDTDMGLYTTTTYYQVTDSVNEPTVDVGSENSKWIELGTESTTELSTSTEDLTDLADVTVADGYYLHIKTVSTCEGYEGYAGAEYVLTITSETCQATEDAVTTEFTNIKTDLSGAVYEGWFPSESD